MCALSLNWRLSTGSFSADATGGNFETHAVSLIKPTTEELDYLDSLLSNLFSSVSLGLSLSLKQTKRSLSETVSGAVFLCRILKLITRNTLTAINFEITYFCLS